MQILALGPFRAAEELPALLSALDAALPGLVQVVDAFDSIGSSPDEPLLLPYLSPHRLLERWGSSPEELALAWNGYGELAKLLLDPQHPGPVRPVNLERCHVPHLVAWLVNGTARPPAGWESDSAALSGKATDPLLALLTLRFLRDHPSVQVAHAQLEQLGEEGATEATQAADARPCPYVRALESLCTPQQLLTAFLNHRLTAEDLAEQQRFLEQRRQDLDHVLEDRDLLSRQLNELNAGFEAFYDQASSDAGKLDWNRKRRAELELTLQLQQRELEGLARQVKEQSSLIKRSAAASEQLMQLMASALSL